MLHVLFCSGRPSHGLPPYFSTCFSLVCTWRPPPQVTLQSVHSLQGSHTQCTAYRGGHTRHSELQVMGCSDSPGQCLRKQVLTWSASPTQSFPPNMGTGSVQLRALCWVPFAQLALQSLQSAHRVQPPSTRIAAMLYRR